MKILHTADWHIGEYKGPEKNGVNLRGQDILHCLHVLVEHAEQENPDLIVVSGDIFNVAKLWSDRVLPEVAAAFDVLARLGQIAPTVLLRGTPNHDGAGQYMVLKKMFAGNTAVQIITEPQVLPVHTKAGPVSVAGLPGFDRGIFRAKFPGVDKEDESQFFTEQLGKIVLGLRAQCEPDLPSVLLAHYTVPGANMESGQTAFFAQSDPVLMPQILDSAGFDLVALGHIHRPQRVSSVSHPCFYSGAVNALNFNDEGQPRGFYLHDTETDEHIFTSLLARQFQTVRLDSADIGALSAGDIFQAAKKWQGQIADKIVRVLYSCTDEQEKALDRRALEQALQLDGAWYVAAIMPESVVQAANKTVMPETGTPKENIRRYFEEKGYPADRIQKLLETAAPILAQVEANKPAASAQGRFEPLRIEVSNYRSYRQAAFDFKDITLCTVNGQNGAGKSSLFMDALLDALFEEPREGVLTGWVSEGAKSGNIQFTFRIGERVFRVARSRTKKSGKLTLNLAEQVEGEWLNRSKERAGDTQKAIIDLLCMDSATLRSCGLIMQDGYGLFLQADRETRMNILTVILGISVYEEMAELAKEQSTELERERRAAADQIDSLSKGLVDEALIQAGMASVQADVKQKQAEEQALTAKADSVRVKLQTRREAEQRVKKLCRSLEETQQDRRSLADKLNVQKQVQADAQAFLNKEPEIAAGVAQHKALLEQEKALLGFKDTYEEKRRALAQGEEMLRHAQGNVTKLAGDLSVVNVQRGQLAASLPDEAKLKEQAARLDAEQQKLNRMEAAAGKYLTLGNTLRALEKQRAGLDAAFRAGKAERTTHIRSLQQRKILLETANCIDIKHAACSFLTDAKQAAAEYPAYWKECEVWSNGQKAAIAALDVKIRAASEQQAALQFDQADLSAQRQTVQKLSQAAAMMERAKGIRAQMNLLDSRIAALQAEQEQANKDAGQAQIELEARRTAFAALSKQQEQYAELQAQIAEAAGWLEKEKLLPVYRDRLRSAHGRAAEIEQEIAKADAATADIKEELLKENQNAEGAGTLETELEALAHSLSDVRAAIQNAMRQIGMHEEQLRVNAETKEKIRVMQEDVNRLAEQCVRMDELKKAFSRDGIPHNIIKSILPVLTDTANAILAQMSGGAMRVRFETEKLLKSNTAKEVETLDVFIDDGQTSRLYASESGGEKVKVSLAVILALSEIKNKRTGVQLGLLFIDEPPFLDADGTQAYCDALEAISRRDSALKIMSITHDPAMKARFPQSVEIVKDSGGSHAVSENGQLLSA